MSYQDKIREFEKMHKKAAECKCWETALNRVYYHMFLIAKFFLIEKNFNYREFLSRFERHEKDKEFSHSTMQAALVSFLNKNYPKVDTKPLMKYGTVLEYRISADYTKDKHDDVDYRIALDYANNIIKQLP